jgi:molybdenum cofactor cytidylyltransferase
MGRPKVLLPWRGRPLLGHVLLALLTAPVQPVVVVTGPDTPSLAAVRPRHGWELVGNPRAAQGMGTSIAAGVGALVGRVDAVLICLGDQPALDPRAVRAIMAHAAAGPPVVPLYRGVQGHPVLFPQTCFPELLRLDGDRGGREVLARHPPLAVALDLPLPADVDSEADYQQLP